MTSEPFPFAAPKPVAPASSKPRIKILVADDDEDVHFVTRIALKEFDFEGRRLEILSSLNTQETKEILLENPDVAVIFLDVVMDVRDAGLRLVEWIRGDWGNKLVRIILRTGHPGDSPEHEIIRKYDINDYKVKTELTQQRLQFALYSALRSWKDLQTIDRSRTNLQVILKIGGELFSAKTLDNFLDAILGQVSSLYGEGMDSVIVRPKERHGLIVNRQEDAGIVVSASGRFAPLIGLDFDHAPEFDFLRKQLARVPRGPKSPMQVIETGLLIFSAQAHAEDAGFVYIENPPQELDLDQVALLMSHFSLALDNFQLIQYVRGLQDDILFTISDVIERHFNETAHHVRRVSTIMAHFGLLLGWKPERAALLRVASIMHDVGKIGIPEAILKKPGTLTAEEYKIMETHAEIGSQMLSKSKIPLFKVAARIARSHHENWDGTGYPDGSAGEAIPLEARMMALVDVFDALRSARVYKPSWPLDKVVAEIQTLSGRKFDPALVQLFLDNVAIMNELVSFGPD